MRETDAFQEDYRTTLEACQVALDEGAFKREFATWKAMMRGFAS